MVVIGCCSMMMVSEGDVYVMRWFDYEYVTKMELEDLCCMCFVKLMEGDEEIEIKKVMRCS